MVQRWPTVLRTARAEFCRRQQELPEASSTLNSSSKEGRRRQPRSRQSKGPKARERDPLGHPSPRWAYEPIRKRVVKDLVLILGACANASHHSTHHRSDQSAQQPRVQGIGSREHGVSGTLSAIGLVETASLLPVDPPDNVGYRSWC
jgi:hypothetical protein